MTFYAVGYRWLKDEPVEVFTKYMYIVHDRELSSSRERICLWFVCPATFLIKINCGNYYNFYGTPKLHANRRINHSFPKLKSSHIRFTSYLKWNKMFSPWPCPYAGVFINRYLSLLVVAECAYALHKCDKNRDRKRQRKQSSFTFVQFDTSNYM